ncbi:MAG: methylenetetrahydrofolate reductase [NAD(P)H] [Parvibaculum sp.]|uniref:methylenetetrahydrofolate reductase [NAD(P)H] n=1 Tax=Parvibaculum sp. TaxID=2024848 RepID=UPI001D43885E|nr:methylenetetrahydrofolate reductase [NAD(P)H] [Parvibaculum sp.]MBX3488657.1 methylenetetrahydrofolate reductase [NAD(P)H] [Parvibaculum sp.]MBX3496739.1 methylenetetrahydrofolate reductase [NAD(P)H] [Parvibaculum sp.]MCW5727460.1 methylenetetrahydrofolate reductase [NAD(P)H] [Parvibaculum sp.]
MSGDATREKRERTRVSFEFFPPKTPEMEQTLWRSIRRLEPLQPEFVSVTYGAGGSTRERTHATVKRILDETTLEPVAHLTCVGATRAEVNDVIRAYWDAGIRHIVALRGDMPELGAPYRPHPEGYQSTPELIAAIRKIGDFDVIVSAYPEKHPESVSLDADIELLKKKVDAGATRAITQFVFDTEKHVRFLEKTQKAGISVPIVPGIMPTTNFKGTKRMAERCGASIPQWLEDYYIGLDDELETRKLIAAYVAAEQVNRLRAYGFDRFHFYTLNQADLTFAICHVLGLRPQAALTPAEPA